MFTGLVDHTGTIEAIGKHPEQPGSIRLAIRTHFSDLALGESIAVDGVCLTVTAIEGQSFTCELSSETLIRSVAGSYRAGDRLNLERALRLGDRLGGHWVTGHVDTTGRLNRRGAAAAFIPFEFSGYPPEFHRLLSPKGSITVNGVSLTVNAVGPDHFEVMLIPHTLAITNLGSLQAGSRVNLEFDAMNKVIVQELDRRMGEGGGAP